MDNWIIFKRITWHIDFLGLPWNFLGFHGKFWGKILHLLVKAFVSAGVSLAPKNRTYTFCSDQIEPILGWHVHDTHKNQPQQTLPNQSSSHHPIIPQLIKHHWFPATTFDPFKIPQCHSASLRSSNGGISETETKTEAPEALDLLHGSVVSHSTQDRSLAVIYK